MSYSPYEAPADYHTVYFDCDRCGGHSVFKICPCYFWRAKQVPVAEMREFPDPRFAFEQAMAEKMLNELDEKAFMLALHHFFNYCFGYHYDLPAPQDNKLAVMYQKVAFEQLLCYLERVYAFVKKHDVEIYHGRQKRVNVHTLVDPLRQIEAMADEATTVLSLLAEKRWV